MVDLHIPLIFWLVFYGFLLAIPVSLLVAYGLAESSWFVLCRFLRHRGWDISADAPPAPSNL